MLHEVFVPSPCNQSRDSIAGPSVVDTGILVEIKWEVGHETRTAYQVARSSNRVGHRNSAVAILISSTRRTARTVCFQWLPVRDASSCQQGIPQKVHHMHHARAMHHAGSAPWGEFSLPSMPYVIVPKFISNVFPRSFAMAGDRRPILVEAKKRSRGSNFVV